MRFSLSHWVRVGVSTPLLFHAYIFVQNGSLFWVLICTELVRNNNLPTSGVDGFLNYTFGFIFINLIELQVTFLQFNRRVIPNGRTLFQRRRHLYGFGLQHPPFGGPLFIRTLLLLFGRAPMIPFFLNQSLLNNTYPFLPPSRPL